MVETVNQTKVLSLAEFRQILGKNNFSTIGLTSTGSFALFNGEAYFINDIMNSPGIPPGSTSGNINGTNQSVTRTLVGGAGVMIQISGTWNAGAVGILFYGSVDGVIFNVINSVINTNTFSFVTSVLSSASNGNFLIPTIAGLKVIKVTSLSTWTSGTANITISETNSIPSSFDYNANLINAKISSAAALTDNTSNPSIGAIQTFPMGWNGTSWDRSAANPTILNTGFQALGSNSNPFTQDAGNNLILSGFNIGITGSGGKPLDNLIHPVSGSSGIPVVVTGSVFQYGTWNSNATGSLGVSFFQTGSSTTGYLAVVLCGTGSGGKIQPYAVSPAGHLIVNTGSVG